jgi:hypothetical protein
MLRKCAVDRQNLLYSYLKDAAVFKSNKDMGDIYEISSNGTDLMFFDMVKMRRTYRFYKGKEIWIINVTPYNHTNLLGQCKTNSMQQSNHMLMELLMGYEVNPEVDFRSSFGAFARKSKYEFTSSGHREIVYTETEDEWSARTDVIKADYIEQSKGMLDKVHFFFVGDDHTMSRPLNFLGYCYYLTYILSLTVSYRFWGKYYKNILAKVFGEDRTEVSERLNDYQEIAKILGVDDTISDIACSYKSLADIQKNVKTRPYIFYEVCKYFFSKGMKFSDQDDLKIMDRSIHIRTVYAALGGKYCLKRSESETIIAYFTAQRATKEELPLLMDIGSEEINAILQKRFSLSR